ncbi:hypothetical protein PT974_10504 [Cladobotryum mycophilum]|uniref:Uncharacterized protein n=1 Tax=Cladobotryum mycophilum TaxID=491253 RepID=A0ABR0SA16_9HYPO
MADDDSIIITDPNELSTLSIGQLISNSVTSQPLDLESMTIPNVKLVLLQPLANPDMLDACYNPFTQDVYAEDGTVIGTAEFEYLNLDPLSLAWRRAIAQVAPIPRESALEPGAARQGGIAVVTQDVCTMVNLLALNMRMRTRRDFLFEIIYDLDEGVREQPMKLLESQLHGLEMRKGALKG